MSARGDIAAAGRRIVRPVPARALIVALLAVAVLPGCGSKAEDPARLFLNNETIERSIERSILAQRHVQAFVSCPALIRIQRNQRFTCVAIVPRNRRFYVRVTQVGDTGGHVHYEGERTGPPAGSTP
jgi:hypothetical protein